MREKEEEEKQKEGSGQRKESKRREVHRGMEECTLCPHDLFLPFHAIFVYFLYAAGFLSSPKSDFRLCYCINIVSRMT